MSFNPPVSPPPDPPTPPLTGDNSTVCHLNQRACLVASIVRVAVFILPIVLAILFRNFRDCLYYRRSFRHVPFPLWPRNDSLTWIQAQQRMEMGGTESMAPCSALQIGAMHTMNEMQPMTLDPASPGSGLLNAVVALLAPPVHPKETQRLIDDTRRASYHTYHTLPTTHNRRRPSRTFGTTSLLKVEESMGRDGGLPNHEAFVPSGLLGCHLANDPSSSSQSVPPQSTSVTPSLPYRQDMSRAEPDLLKRFPRLHDSTDVTAATSSVPIVLPRPSLRSSTFDGKSIFLKRESRASLDLRASAPDKSMGNLLGTPIHRLLDELSATTAQRLMHSDSDPSTSKDPSSSSTKETLWVDRYRPKRVTDLLGDERVHREVLAWMKQWDVCVFGKGKGGKRARDGDRFGSEDKLGRPQER
ncbi:hypothetical protein BC827DRAFT_1153171 [Russula dissimulans]|nr:hypothetical protein BC827DRAFT_1153171 [Russula dissimulans]